MLANKAGERTLRQKVQGSQNLLEPHTEFSWPYDLTGRTEPPLSMGLIQLKNKQLFPQN
jgi:hypothetical protein